MRLCIGNLDTLVISKDLQIKKSTAFKLLNGAKILVIAVYDLVNRRDDICAISYAAIM